MARKMEAQSRDD